MAGGDSADVSVCVMSAKLRGVEALPITVEVRLSGGIPGIDVIGTRDPSILEARSRVRCAINSAGFEMPRLKVTVNLAPGDVRKSGTAFDLPIAVGILIATRQVNPRIADEALFFGELALDGRVCPGRGEAAYVLLAEKLCGLAVLSDLTELIGPSAERVRLISNLSQLREGLDGLGLAARGTSGQSPLASTPSTDLDFADVVDQEMAKRAMVIAASGRHGMLMVGPPGAGKTMLARRMPGILPPLTEEERAEALLVHSVAGQPIEAIARGVRPFRAPHHSISAGGLVGGGRPVLPGEISLADKGVLFLDELPEFANNVLQSLRAPGRPRLPMHLRPLSRPVVSGQDRRPPHGPHRRRLRRGQALERQGHKGPRGPWHGRDGPDGDGSARAGGLEAGAPGRARPQGPCGFGAHGAKGPRDLRDVRAAALPGGKGHRARCAGCQDGRRRRGA